MDSHLISPSECAWADAPTLIALPQDRVDLWRVRLKQPNGSISHLERTLAPDERARADRFHFDRDRRRFIVSRAQLRMILARYVGDDPHALVFSYGSRGKPFLAHLLEPPLRFNLSHSGELALVAVTSGRHIGVDIEELRSSADVRELAERFFSPQENAALCALPDTVRLEAFFCCWTLKEAYVKATGDGLGRATDSFDVAFGSGKPARLLSVEGNVEEAARWSLLKLSPAPGFVGALAVEGSGWNLMCWDPHR